MIYEAELLKGVGVMDIYIYDIHSFFSEVVLKIYCIEIIFKLFFYSEILLFEVIKKYFFLINLKKY